ncbi:hypothetical protein HMPREF0659_A6569 [Prevotella melaninogenica ATCC 25845]|nr:hypothetical protein HMPREF0659_A6569 [Prevotella melaninogenica ATCC 25845]
MRLTYYDLYGLLLSLREERISYKGVSKCKYHFDNLTV